MKFFLKAALLVFIVQSCTTHERGINEFTAANDTLIIKTVREKGTSMFPLGVALLFFTRDTFPYPVKLPAEITNIEYTQLHTDLQTKNPHYIDIITGNRESKEVFIIDENNNRDFRDDSIRVPKEIDWKSSRDAIKCDFSISNGKEIVKESSWIRIGTAGNPVLQWGRYEYAGGNFSINTTAYKIAATDRRNAQSFSFSNETTIALIKNNTTLKDTLFEKDYIKLGESIKLNDTYYRFESITNNGEKITLVKEKDLSKKTGTQVGALAPKFTGTTTTGKTISSVNLHDRPLIIVNSCSCGGDEISTQAFYDIKNKYGNKAYVLRLDSKIKNGKDGLQLDTENKLNEDIYNKYRGEYCSRITYVIGKDNRVITKFDASQWKVFLPEILKD